MRLSLQRLNDLKRVVTLYSSQAAEQWGCYTHRELKLHEETCHTNQNDEFGNVQPTAKTCPKKPAMKQKQKQRFSSDFVKLFISSTTVPPICSMGFQQIKAVKMCIPLNNTTREQ